MSSPKQVPGQGSRPNLSSSISVLPLEILWHVFEIGCQSSKFSTSQAAKWKHFEDIHDDRIYDLGTGASRFLTLCSLVCREWFNYVRGLLYREIRFQDLEKVEKFSENNVIGGNRQCVRALSFDFCDRVSAYHFPILARKLIQGLDNLTTLKIVATLAICSTAEEWEPGLRFVWESVPQLTKLDIHGPYVRIGVAPAFEKLIRNLNHLTVLSISPGILASMRLSRLAEDDDKGGHILNRLQSLSIYDDGSNSCEESVALTNEIINLLLHPSLSELKSFAWDVWSRDSWVSSILDGLGEVDPKKQSRFCSGPNLLYLKVIVGEGFRGQLGSVLKDQCSNLVECSFRFQSPSDLEERLSALRALPPSIQTLELDFTGVRFYLMQKMGTSLIDAAINGKEISTLPAPLSGDNFASPCHQFNNLADRAILPELKKLVITMTNEQNRESLFQKELKEARVVERCRRNGIEYNSLCCE